MTGNPDVDVSRDGGRVTGETLRGWHSVKEIGLAMLIWTLGFTLIVLPLGTEGHPVEPVLAVFVQLPLAIRYDRARGVTAPPETRWQFPGSRLFFHPVLIYGVFALMLAGFELRYAYGDHPGEVFVLSYVLYFPIVVTVMLLLKGSHWGVRRLLPRFRAPDGVSGVSRSGDGSSDGRDRRFVGLLALVMLPVGASWIVGQPNVGVGIATLILTVYEIAYRPGSGG